MFDHPQGYVPRFAAGAAPKARALRASATGASVFNHPQGNFYRVSEASEDGSKRPERSEGRLRSPVGANAMQRLPQARSACCRRAAPAGVDERRRRERVRSPAGVPVFGARDGSKRPERKRGSFALTHRGIYQCSITRRGGDR